MTQGLRPGIVAKPEMAEQFADKCDKWMRTPVVDLFIRCVVYYCSSKKLNKLIFFELKQM